MEVPLPNRGLKRVCASCQTKFYDFNKSPVICPKCKAEFTGVVKIRTRRGRNVIEEAKAKSQVEDDTPEVEEEDDRTTVSLEEVEEAENDTSDEGEDTEGGDLDLDDLDTDDDDEDEDLDDLDEDIEVEEKE